MIQREKNIILNVHTYYENAIEKAITNNVFDARTWKRQFKADQKKVLRAIANEDIREAIDITIDIFNYLSEEEIISQRVRYPGPTPAFKRLVAKYFD